MSQTTPPPVDPLPPAPNTANPSTFSALADVFLAALLVFRDQLVALAQNVYDNAVDAYSNALASLGYANNSAASATQAGIYAASSAASAGAVVWVSGTTYQQYAAVFSPAALRAYRRITAAGISNTDPSLDPTNWTPELPQQVPYLHIIDQKASGTAGATLTNATWNTREANTTVSNSITGASLSSNQYVLPAGTYEMDGWAQLVASGAGGQSHLYNVTDGVVLLPAGNLGVISGGGRMTLAGKFTLAATKTIAIRSWPGSSGGSPSAGSAIGTGQPEVYLSVRFKKVA